MVADVNISGEGLGLVSIAMVHDVFWIRGTFSAIIQRINYAPAQL
jgi:hypothetical protein